MATIEYRSEIDGLRAVAVIPVILFHMKMEWIPGGFLGVDVFFVISGFLITSILKSEIEQGKFTFSNFWARRIRRILPAMIFVTSCTLTATTFLVFRPEQQSVANQALAALLSVANIYFWRNAGDYWGTAAENSPFLHAWSLSVEEQFYLLFPLSTWLVLRFRSRWLQAAILAGVIFSLMLFLWGSKTHPTATFYLLPTRVWELGTGALLAVSLSNRPQKHSMNIFAIAGLNMIILSYLYIDKPNAGLILAVFGAALIIAFGQSGLCNRLLSHRFVVHVGRISYSLYLWHWPILVLASPTNIAWDDSRSKLLLIGLTYVLSLGTYHLIEKPTRQRPRVVIPILMCGAAVAAIAFSMGLTPRYYDTSQFHQSAWMHNFYNVFPDATLVKEGARTHGIEMPPPKHLPDQFRRGGIVTLRDSASPEIVLLGDSHAIMWAVVLDDIAEAHGISTAFYTMSGRDPFCELPPKGEHRNVSHLPSDLSLEVDEIMLEMLKRWKPKAVLISCFWNRVDMKRASQLINWLFDQGVLVLLIEDPPHLEGIDGRNAMQFALWKGMSYNGGDQYWPIHDNSPNEFVHNMARDHSHLRVVPIHDIYALGQSALLFRDRDCVYVDDDHLTSYGAKLAEKQFELAILEATR